MKKRLHPRIPVALFLWAGIACNITAHAENITVAVANSTCTAMHKLGELFQQQSGHTISYQCKASGLLAKGLKGGAISADIYVSASKKWMDFMTEAGMVSAQNVVTPWGNELVVAAAKNSRIEISDWKELASPKVKTILIGDPGTAPFGRYAKQAMEHTGIWEQAKSKITTKKHITLVADTLAKADDSTVGILFSSNTTAKHRVLLRVDASWHSPIRYYAAPLKGSEGRASANDLLRFMQGKEAQAIFSAAGFKVYAP